MEMKLIKENKMKNTDKYRSVASFNNETFDQLKSNPVELVNHISTSIANCINKIAECIKEDKCNLSDYSFGTKILRETVPVSTKKQGFCGFTQGVMVGVQVEAHKLEENTKKPKRGSKEEYEFLVKFRLAD